MSHSQKQGSTVFLRKSGGSAEKLAHFTEKSVPGLDNPPKMSNNPLTSLWHPNLLKMLVTGFALQTNN